jgi:multidrug efflux pump subunit AcrA (membrane-fusion protein)
VWLSEDFEEGAAVEAGELLVRIDDRDAIGRRDTAKADLAETEADLRDAQRRLELAEAELEAAIAQATLQESSLARQRDLRERGVGTEAAVEAANLAASAAAQSVLTRRLAVAQAETRIDQAGITLDRRRIAVSEAERRVADTQIRAEFPGRLAEVNVVQGGLVSTNETLAELIDPDALEAAFRVSAAQYAKLLGENGALRPAEITISLDVGGVDISSQGRITRESPAVGEGLTGRLLFASLDATPGFRPGDFVAVRITEGPLSGVAVLPAAALDAAGTVLALGVDDRLEQIAATLLRRQGDQVIISATGLEGLEVVSERNPLLGAGIRVRPVRPSRDTAEARDGTGEEYVELGEERRARLMAFVEANDRMTPEAKERLLSQLRQQRVPVQMVSRIESRMGG